MLFAGLFLGACAGTPDQAASIDQTSVTTKVFAPLTADCGNSNALGDGGHRTAIDSVAIAKTLKLGEGGHIRAVNALSLKVMIGDGPHAPAVITLVSDTCSGVVVQVSGSAMNSESILVNIDGKAFTVSVNANGHFDFSAQVPSATNVELTPIDLAGNLGDVLTKAF